MPLYGDRLIAVPVDKVDQAAIDKWAGLPTACLRALSNEQQHLYSKLLVVANRLARFALTRSLVLALPLKFGRGKKAIFVFVFVRRGTLDRKSVV